MCKKSCCASVVYRLVFNMLSAHISTAPCLEEFTQMQIKEFTINLCDVARYNSTNIIREDLQR